MRQYLLVSLFTALLTSVFFIAFDLNFSKAVAQKSIKPIEEVLPQQPSPQLKLNEALPANLFVELAKAVNPSVVNISTSAIPRGRARDPMVEMLERFYGIQPQDNIWNNKPRRMGLGTGFIIRGDGLIVTNAHVIRDADIIEVQLTENSEKQYKAEVIGSDQRTDIALIKIKPDTKLAVASLGSSKDVQVGEWVAAFGNPYGHGHTMTKGIISSKGRTLQEINKFPLLQTDASINPGNSGGPLVNSKGQVIGVNSAIDARAQGIGFAIPIDEVKSILPQLEKSGGLRKGYMGLGLEDIHPRTAEYLKLDEDNLGSAIMGVQPGGPADKAGLKPYDLIIELNGVKVKNTQDLMDTISDTPPGTKVKVKFFRDNNGKAIEKETTVQISERPDEKKILQQRFLERPSR